MQKKNLQMPNTVPSNNLTTEKNNLEVKCSPRTFKRVEDDEEYRQAVVAQLSGMEEYTEIIFLPKNDTEMDAQKTIWLDASTKLLISLVKEIRPKVGKSLHLKNKRQMWVPIAEKLCANGHNFNASPQVEGRYFTLERQYKRAQLNNKQTGRSRQTCHFQSELDDLLREKRSVNHEYFLDSETEVNSNNCSVSECPNSSQENLDMTDSCSKRRKTSSQEYVENAERHAQKKEANKEKLYKLLEANIVEQRKGTAERKEWAERKEANDARKIALLESSVLLLKKDD